MPTRRTRQVVKAVVFDIGGVLLDWNPRHLYRKLIADEREMDRFLSEICTLEWHASHDRGVPVEQSCARLAAAHPDYAQLIWAWGERSEEMIAGPIAGSVELLRELKERGVRCYALTNMEAETYPLRLARFDFLHWFDGTVVSAYEGTIKPEPQIFRRLLERYALDPVTTLLIDDSPRNVRAAERIGMRALLFRSAEQLRSDLEQLGLLDPR